MITFEVNDKAVIAHLGSVDAMIMAAVSMRVKEYGYFLQDYIQTEKLHGQVLNHLSGALENSITLEFSESGRTVLSEVFSAGDVKYAAIHEFGGIIPTHTIEAKPGGVLSFEWNGARVFFKSVKIPDVHMPERSFMRSSLAENAEMFERGILEAALKAAAGDNAIEGLNE